MSIGFHLENLARVVHVNKMDPYAQERFARQVELTQERSSTLVQRSGS